MTRETKVGLLVGLGMILLIGIIVSDHLSVVSNQEAANLTHYADGAQRSVNGGQTPTPAPASRHAPTGIESAHHTQQQVPMAQELRQPPLQQADTDLSVEPRRGDSYPQRAYALDTREEGHGSVRDIVTRDRTVPGGEDPARIHEPVQDQRLAALQQQGDFTPVRHELDRGATYQVGSNTLRFNDAPAVQREQPHQMTQAAVPTASTQPTVVVKSGQTLTAIAREHLGNGNRWKEIFELNRDKLDAPENLKAGMEIRLPRTNTPVAQAPQVIEQPQAVQREQAPQPQRLQDVRMVQRQNQPAGERAAAQPVSARTYTVQRGDTLSKIAEKTLGDPNQWRRLYQANKTRISNPDAVQVGLELTIPQG
jgi:nucleoid-associated protein YgaU